MKADLDRLMLERGLDAFVVECTDHFSAERDYLTNGARITHGRIVKKQGEAPILVVNGMETEEAKKSGLKVYSYADLGYAALLKQLEGDSLTANIRFWGTCLRAAGVEAGKVGVYGVGSLNDLLDTIQRVRATLTDYVFVGEPKDKSIFSEAYKTKDAEEIARMKSLGQRTSEVLQATWDFIASQRVEGEQVLKTDGSPLTIGDVKRFVRHALLDRDLEDTAMIFAQGRDAGFPHSRGESDQALRLGESIVFDLFPREQGGGYYHDCTRTWSLGYASQAVQQAYDQVMEAFDLAVEIIRPGMTSKTPQISVLDYFESKGHKTGRSHPGTQEGYVHSLGHGVGLNIHEAPGMGVYSTDTLVPGNIITIEPGLYYPEQGFGVRVEDTFVIEPSGELVSLTPFRKDLVLPLKG